MHVVCMTSMFRVDWFKTRICSYNTSTYSNIVSYTNFTEKEISRVSVWDMLQRDMKTNHTMYVQRLAKTNLVHCYKRPTCRKKIPVEVVFILGLM